MKTGRASSSQTLDPDTRDTPLVGGLAPGRPGRGIPEHPTRRADGRTPNPREAETAIAAALNAPREALELLVPANGESRAAQHPKGPPCNRNASSGSD